MQKHGLLDFFARASSKSLCASAAFEQGIASVAEFLDDIAIDAPKAPKLLAIMIKGADLSEAQRTWIADKLEGSGAKLLELTRKSFHRRVLFITVLYQAGRTCPYPTFFSNRRDVHISCFQSEEHCQIFMYPPGSRR